MKMNKLKKVCAALLTMSMIMPSAAVLAENESYTVVYDIDNEGAAAGDVWAHIVRGDEGEKTFCTTEGFSGTQSIKVGSNGSGYASVRFGNGLANTDGKAVLTNGSTYVLSYKLKKIDADSTVGFSGVRDSGNGSSWIWGLGEKFKPAANGWRSVSHTFTVGSSFTSDGSTLTGNPNFVYSSSVKGEYILLVDDFRVVQINDASILEADPTAEVTELTAEKLTVTFAQEMSADVKNPKAYIINGAEAQSVEYNETTKTAEVTPSAALTPETDANVTISACDYIGRAIYSTFTKTVAYPAETICTTSVNEEEDEIDSIDSVTVSFSNTVNNLTKANCTFTPADESNTGAISSVDKVDGKNFKINFGSFLKAGEYTLKISGVEDAYGRTVADKEVSFRVKKVIPAVVSATPEDGTSELPTGSTSVSVTFNKDINDTGAYDISADNGAEISNISVSGNVVTFTLSKLEAAKTYTVTLKGFEDTDGEEAAETTLTYYTMLEMPCLYENHFENATASGGVVADIDYRRVNIEGKKTIETSEYADGSSSMKVVMTDKYNADLWPGTGADANYRVRLDLGKRYRMTFCVKIPDGSDVKGFTAVNGDNKTYLGSRQNLKSSKTAVEGRDGWYRYVYDFTAESQNDSDKTSGTAYCPSLRFELNTSAASANSIFYFDDLEIYQYPDVSLADSTVENNAENVAADEPIQLVFNGGITAASAKIGDIVCNVSVDGNRVNITPKKTPEYGRYYELEVSITDKNGVESTHKLQFKTETAVRVTDVKIGGSAYTEEMSLSKNADASVSLKTSAAAAKDIYGVVMVYGEDGYCKAMKCSKLSASSGNDTVQLTIEKSLLADGKYAKLYIWNSLDKMEIIHNSMTFNLQ